MALLPRCPWGPGSLQGTPTSGTHGGGKDAIPPAPNLTQSTWHGHPETKGFSGDVQGMS